MKRNQTYKGVIIMIGSSLLTCSGQLLWKLASFQNVPISYWVYLGGLALYGIGALAIMIALRYGELSVLHPMLSVGYIVSLFLAWYVLGEEITLNKIAGVLLILVGVVLLGLSSKERKEKNE